MGIEEDSILSVKDVNQDDLGALHDAVDAATGRGVEFSPIEKLRLAVAYIRQNRLDSAGEIVDEVIAHTEDTDSSSIIPSAKLKAKATMTLGLIEVARGNFSSGLENFISTASMYEELKQQADPPIGELEEDEYEAMWLGALGAAADCGDEGISYAKPRLIEFLKSHGFIHNPKSSDRTIQGSMNRYTFSAIDTLSTISFIESAGTNCDPWIAFLEDALDDYGDATDRAMFHLHKGVLMNNNLAEIHHKPTEEEDRELRNILSHLNSFLESMWESGGLIVFNLAMYETACSIIFSVYLDLNELDRAEESMRDFIRKVRESEYLDRFQSMTLWEWVTEHGYTDPDSEWDFPPS